MEDQSRNHPLTEEQQLEQQRMLAEALEKADLAVKAKNAFLSHISHEMRTPLNAIFGFTTLAKTSLHDPDTLEEYLDQVEIAAHQLLDMINQALDVSTLNNAAGFAQEECDLEELLQEVYGFLMPQAREKHINFTLDYTGVNHLKVYTDAKRVKQLLLNLANNAVTYTGEGGRVEVVLKEEKPLPNNHAVYRLEVRDTGIGISEEFLEDAFEPFSRDKSSSLSSVRGIGLGLTIAKSIVDALKGTITVKSVVNEGSTFIITLAFRIQSLPEDAKKQSGKLRILLVEDNDLNREIESEILRGGGFVVDTAENGSIAVEKMKNADPEDYDLIIMDLQMPGMNGWQVSSAVRKLSDPVLARIPIIALSANVSVQDRRKSLDSGIDVHLAKPMDLNVLLETIEKITKKPLK